MDQVNGLIRHRNRLPVEGNDGAQARSPVPAGRIDVVQVDTHEEIAGKKWSRLRPGLRFLAPEQRQESDDLTLLQGSGHLALLKWLCV